MNGTKRNIYLDAESDEDDGTQRSYDSEGSGGFKQNKAATLGTRNAKRRKTSHSGSESDEDFEPDEVQLHDRGEIHSLASADVEEDVWQDASAVADGGINDLHHATKKQDLKKPTAKARKRKTGVVYLSRIPPFMKPTTVRQLLSPYGTITRLFLTPEPQAHYLARKKNHGNKKRSFLDGWVEYSSKRHAKACAETINGELVGGKKGGWYHDDIWNAKYLKGFKWDDLMEGVRSEERAREERMRVEIRRETKERKAFLENFEQSKKERGMEKKRAEKRKGLLPDMQDSTTLADPQIHGEKERPPKKIPERRFKQSEVRTAIKGTPADQPDEVKRVLSKIF